MYFIMHFQIASGNNNLMLALVPKNCIWQQPNVSFGSDIFLVLAPDSSPRNQNTIFFSTFKKYYLSLKNKKLNKKLLLAITFQI